MTFTLPTYPPMPERVLGEVHTGPLSADEIEVWDTLANVTTVRVDGDELMAVCPVTGQPDIYTFHIEHEGGRECEGKALKLWLWSFRDVPISCSDLAGMIAGHLSVRLGVPVRVVLHQNTRGGMRLSATAIGEVPE